MHPAIVSRAEYDTVAARAAANEASRRPTTGQPAAERTRTEYLYRGLVRCGICGLRMSGNIRRRTGRRYYFCYPHKQRTAKIPPDHDFYHDTKQRIDHKRAAISVARKIARRSHHILRNLGDQAWAPAT